MANVVGNGGGCSEVWEGAMPYMLLHDRLAASSFVLCDALVEGFPIRYASQGFVDLFGYTAAECLGQKCSALVGGKAVLDHDPDLIAASTETGLTPSEIKAGLETMRHHTATEIQGMMRAPFDDKVIFAVLCDRKKSGKLLTCEVVLWLQRHPSFGWQYYVGMQKDITKDLPLADLLRQAASGSYQDVLASREASVREGSSLLQSSDTVQYLHGKAAEMWRALISERISDAAQAVKPEKPSTFSSDVRSICSRSTASGASKKSSSSCASSVSWKSSISGFKGPTAGGFHTEPFFSKAANGFNPEDNTSEETPKHLLDPLDEIDEKADEEELGKGELVVRTVPMGSWACGFVPTWREWSSIRRLPARAWYFWSILGLYRARPLTLCPVQPALLKVTLLKCVLGKLAKDMLGDLSSESQASSEVAESPAVALPKCVEFQDLCFSTFVVDPSRQGCPFVACSCGFAEFTGHASNEVVGSSFFDMLSFGNESSSSDRFQKLVENARCGMYMPQERCSAFETELGLEKLREGEMVCVQEVSARAGTHLKSVVLLQQLELEDEMFILGLASGPLEELDIEHVYEDLELHLDDAQMVLAKSFWLCAPMRRQMSLTS